MEIMLGVISLTFGLIFGLYVYAQMLLPILYGLPRAIWMFIRGELRFMGVITQIITPLIWFVFFIVLGFILQAVYPPAIKYFTTDAGFFFGQLLAIVWLILNFLSSRGRRDMREDFMQTTYRRYGK